MTAEIVVRRCRAHVVRHGGWSWGPDPRRLVDRLLGVLADLVAGHADELVATFGANAEIVEPVRLTVSLPRDRLLDRNATASRPAAVQVGPPLTDPVVLDEAADPADEAAAQNPSVAAVAPGAPVGLLSYLVMAHRRDELSTLLALTPAATLTAWWAALLDRPIGWGLATDLVQRGAYSVQAGGRKSRTHTPDRQDQQTVDVRDAEASLADALDRIVARNASGADDSTGLRAQLGELVALAASVGTHEVERLLASRGPHDQFAAEEQTARAADDRAGTVPQGPQARAVETRQPNQVTTVQVDVDSVLPFLLLRPLYRLGYLDALQSMLTTISPEANPAAFATGLAYTVLRPLDRGWHRAPGDVTTATVFSGLDAPLPESALAAFARRAAPALPGLDAVVAAVLTRGHTPGRPLLLSGIGDRLGGGLLLADSEGLFPIAWADRVDDLLPVWHACGSPLVFIRPSGLEVDIVGQLQRAGVRFVADAPPTRHERWRRLPPPLRLWTNDHGQSLALLGRQAADFATAGDRLDEMVAALAGARRAVTLADDAGLGRSLLLAATLGLGTLAWTLWRHREAPDPLLALERFGDLSGRVRLEAGRILVRMPLGRRHADLFAHDLLGEVPRVPWLRGRVVELSGG